MPQINRQEEAIRAHTELEREQQIRSSIPRPGATQIGEYLNDLQKKLSNYRDLHSLLIDRLSPILLPDIPVEFTEKDGSGTPAWSGSPMSHELKNLSMRIDSMTEDLDLLVSRINL
jgi:hypothetical protein